MKRHKSYLIFLCKVKNSSQYNFFEIKIPPDSESINPILISKIKAKPHSWIFVSDGRVLRLLYLSQTSSSSGYSVRFELNVMYKDLKPSKVEYYSENWFGVSAESKVFSPQFLKFARYTIKIIPIWYKFEPDTPDSEIDRLKFLEEEPSVDTSEESPISNDEFFKMSLFLVRILVEGYEHRSTLYHLFFKFTESQKLIKLVSTMNLPDNKKKLSTVYSIFNSEAQYPITVNHLLHGCDTVVKHKNWVKDVDGMKKPHILVNAITVCAEVGRSATKVYRFNAELDLKLDIGLTKEERKKMEILDYRINKQMVVVRTPI